MMPSRINQEKRGRHSIKSTRCEAKLDQSRGKRTAISLSLRDRLSIMFIDQSDSFVVLEIMGRKSESIMASRNRNFN